MATSERADPFPDTRWSLVLAGERGVALEHLAAAYWRPIYGYVRARWARDEAEALDATQDFFVHLVEGELLQRAERGRGRFRAYVRTALAHFLTDEARKRGARQRGGDRRFVPLDDAEALALPETAGRAPEEALDELWRAEVLERAVRILQGELEREGKTKMWAVFQDSFQSGELSHGELAARHGVARTDVSNWLTRCRARYRDALVRIVRETVDGREGLEAELAWLLGEGPA